MRLARASAARRYGGKAASLARAAAAGLPVPDGAALAPYEAAAVARGERAAVVRLRGDLPRAAGPLAVRSSALGEDGARHSFAGQHATRLNVDRDGLPVAVRAVLDSGVSAAAGAYRHRRRIAGPVAVAVFVQELVAADVAGVMFTRDPLSGAASPVVEAAWGLGEAVVGGLVVPDRYLLHPHGTLIASEPGDKDVEVVALDAGGTAVRAVARARARRRCLGDGQLAALAELGAGCEALLGAGQDVEWAFAGGELWLLQSRPMTGRFGTASSATV